MNKGIIFIIRHDRINISIILRIITHIQINKTFESKINDVIIEVYHNNVNCTRSCWLRNKFTPHMSV